MQKYFGFIVALDDYSQFYRTNKELIESISKKFEKIYVINVYHLKLRDKSGVIKNDDIFPKNFQCINFFSSKDFLKFFKNKFFVAIQYLDKNPDFFRIFFLIKLAKIKNIMIMNLGNFGLSRTVDFNSKYIFAFKHYYTKGFYKLFRILTILNIFPKIDILFETNTELINSINNGYLKKIERKFPFLKLSYFQKIEKVNSLFYDQYLTSKTIENHENKKNILLVDVPIDHLDRTAREGPVEESIKESYYRDLSHFLTRLSEILNMDVIVGLHPSSKNVDKFFTKLNLSKKRTIDLIPDSEIIVVTHSSLISMLALYKKKIISIRSKYMGKFHTELSNNYSNSLNLFTLNIDKELNFEKEFILNKLELAIKEYDTHIRNYVKVDGENLSHDTIIKKIKNTYFF